MAINQKSNDSLLANLNEFRSKVKSGSVLGFRKTPSPIKKRTFLQLKEEEKSNFSATSTEDDDGIEILGEEKVPSTRGSSVGVSAYDPLEVPGDDDYDSSPSKKVRPGSIAAAALQASQSSISRSHDSSKLLWATEYIQKKGKPVPLQELMDYLSLNPDDKVIELLKKLEKIEFDPTKNSFRYLSTYDVHSAAELLNLLRSQVTFKGISCKELKDGWPQCDETINELEEESKILVLRTKKDRTPRYVWYNNGGDLHRIDEEFIKMWENVQLPQFSELPRKLQDLGLKPASIDPATVKRQTTTQEVKKKKQRKGKITNTHMAGILKDYSHRV